MQPDRSQEVKRILESAMERSPAERDAFLAEACSGDEILRQKIESLLAGHEEADSYVEQPADATTATLITDEREGQMIGRRLGRYQIISKIGEGGMGEVFLAEDSSLGRQVALKLLPAHLAAEYNRVQRFKQEARAASALNHPNIITIYEIGEADHRHFIATEFIEGETLRTRMASTRPKLAEALDIAYQTASALAAAHAAGITHRDIKPENIMVRRDGIVKVLDFGLAKLIEKGIQGTELSTLVKTDEGIVMGTVLYMSPEQARGLPVTKRTDIWSLGVVLYEMVTGRVAFGGSTSSDVIVSILEREPAPLALYSPDAPSELQRIIKKALCKDCEERYQLVKEMALDLKMLRRELEIKSEVDRAVQSTGDAVDVTSTQQSGTEITIEPVAATSEVRSAHPTSSAEYIVGEVKRHKWAVGATLLVLVLGLTGLATFYGLYWQNTQAEKPAPARQAMRISRLTNTGKANLAAISPDGKYVIHVLNEAGRQSLRVRHVTTSSDVEIMPPSEVEYRGLTFSRDGDFIYYVASDANNPTPALYQVPVLGGTARKLIESVDSSVTVSPDGKQLAFIRSYAGQGEQSVVVASIDGSSQRRVVTRKLPNFFGSVSWSPDGSHIACGAGSYVPVYSYYLVAVSVADGRETKIGSHNWRLTEDLAWMPNGSGLILVASEQGTGTLARQIWHISYPDGAARRITNDLNDYRGVSLTGDSSRLVTSQTDLDSNIWLAPNGEADRSTQVGRGRHDGYWGLASTPDGRIVYTSQSSDREDIWIMNADGSGNKQLTVNSSINTHPSVTSDGRFILFVSDRSGTSNIWRMDIDGSNPKQLTSGTGEEFPRGSPDGMWAIYTLRGAGTPTIWRVPIDGGSPQQLTERYAAMADISPDGESMACIYRDEQPNASLKIAVFRLGSDEPPKVFTNSNPDAKIVRWKPDGRAVTYIATRNGISNIWSQPMDGGQPAELTNFRPDQVLWWFDWSRDGRWLATARGAENNDIILISDFN